MIPTALVDLLPFSLVANGVIGRLQDAVERSGCEPAKDGGEDSQVAPSHAPSYPIPILAS